MKGETTLQAFTRVINMRGIYKALDMNESTLRQLRRKLRDGEVITIDKMEEVLKKAGFKVIQEKLWSLPGGISIDKSWIDEAVTLFGEAGGKTVTVKKIIRAIKNKRGE